jgi:DNA-nicking Smr family endonuclease
MTEEPFHKIPPSGTIDLHHFQPSETKEIIGEFIFACRQEGITCGKIIHGKGIGTLREIVHSQLSKHPEVESFSLGEHNSGGWGATIFKLKA